MKVTRRHVLWSAAAVTAGFASLKLIRGDRSEKSDLAGAQPADPKAQFHVPPGFEYAVISRAGRKMDDGFYTPGLHDGMAAFPGPGGRTILVCNHELDAGTGEGSAFGKKLELMSDDVRKRMYDPGKGKKPFLGGTTTVVYNTKSRKVERQFLSLSGTARNCAGGPTPWGSWVTCEESVANKGGDTEKDHGYNFEVPATDQIALTEAVPLRDMGRFNHEAVAVHPTTGIVYQTEDRGDGLIYRFIPDKPGKLIEGGRLQALKVRDAKSLDTRNWHRQTVKVGQTMEVEWVDLEDIESPSDELRYEGFFAGRAARFARGEGMWYGRGGVYFACTNGGDKRKGQIWKYTPSRNEGRPDERSWPGKLELFVEPDDSNIAEAADNLTVSPWGDVFVCEDNGLPTKRLLRVTPSGQIVEFARNLGSSSELAGVTFSPDGSTLFVNVQRDGMTVAIWGPWKSLGGAEHVANA